MKDQCMSILMHIQREETSKYTNNNRGTQRNDEERNTDENSNTTTTCTMYSHETCAKMRDQCMSILMHKPRNCPCTVTKPRAKMRGQCMSILKYTKRKPQARTSWCSAIHSSPIPLPSPAAGLMFHMVSRGSFPRAQMMYPRCRHSSSGKQST